MSKESIYRSFLSWHWLNINLFFPWGILLSVPYFLLDLSIGNNAFVFYALYENSLWSFMKNITKFNFPESCEIVLFFSFFLPSFVSCVSHYFSEILLLNNLSGTYLLSSFIWFQFYFIGSLHAISGYLPWNSFPRIDFMKLRVMVVTYRIIMGRQD